MSGALEAIMVIFVVGGVSLFIYFIPSFAAGTRHRNFNAILVLNIFLGWTFIGWVIALVWACMDSQKDPPPPARNDFDGGVTLSDG